MGTFGNAFVVSIIAAAITGGAYAQWPSFNSTRVPRTQDGRPVLDGPTPRTPDGKPDLPGVWQAINAAAASDTGPAAAAPGTRPRQFWNIGSTLKDGLPFTAWGAEARKQRVAENNKDNPDAHCLPVGLMQLDTHPQPRKIIQTPNELVILYEVQAGVRQMLMADRCQKMMCSPGGMPTQLDTGRMTHWLCKLPASGTMSGSTSRVAR